MGSPLPVLVPLAVAFLSPPLTWLVGRAGLRAAHLTAVAGALLTFGAVLGGLLAGGGEWAFSWVPTWGLEARFALDGLAALYGLVASGIGAVVVIYSGRYIEEHLREKGRLHEAPRFHALVLLFLAAMLGLATAQDLLLLFVFFDLTAIVSYLLIGFDHDDDEARASSLAALLVTAGSGVLLLAAVAWTWLEARTLRISDLGPLPAGIAVLVLIPAMAKSAQVPLHFWLPRAMVAPTPVSAYLHSAAMVAAGVFLISRLHPILPPQVLAALVAVGFVSILVGGLIALSEDALKRILAGSTIAQYGYMMVLLGLGDVAGASFYVAAHALAKSALFLTAGTVTVATGERTLSAVGGLARQLPALAAASLVASAALAGLPLTLGFFKDEVFFTAVAGRGAPFVGLGLAAAISTFAYSARFWTGIFLGSPRHERARAPASLVIPVVLVSVLLLAGGWNGAGLRALAGSAAGTGPLELAYHLDLRLENVLALATWCGGALLFAALPRLRPAIDRALTAAGRVGPGAIFDALVAWLGRTARALHDLEVRLLRPRLAHTLIPTAALVALAIFARWKAALVVGPVGHSDLPLLLGLAVASGGALATISTASDTAMVMALTVVGFALAALFALLHAPEVALVAALVETISTILLLAFVMPLPSRSERAAPARKPWMVGISSVLAAGFAFVVTWEMLSRPAGRTVATRYMELAHGEGVVGKILSDFRGLDTVGELTVIVLSLATVAVLLHPGPVVALSRRARRAGAGR